MAMSHTARLQINKKWVTPLRRDTHSPLLGSRPNAGKVGTARRASRTLPMPPDYTPSPALCQELSRHLAAPCILRGRRPGRHARPCGQERDARAPRGGLPNPLAQRRGPRSPLPRRSRRLQSPDRSLSPRQGVSARGTRIVGRPKALGAGGLRSARSGDRNAAVGRAARLPQGHAATPNGNATLQSVAGAWQLPAAGVRCPVSRLILGPTVPVPFPRCGSNRTGTDPPRSARRALDRLPRPARRLDGIGAGGATGSRERPSPEATVPCRRIVTRAPAASSTARPGRRPGNTTRRA